MAAHNDPVITSTDVGHYVDYVTTIECPHEWDDPTCACVIEAIIRRREKSQGDPMADGIEGAEASLQPAEAARGEAHA
jgi:hypothetical protein